MAARDGIVQPIPRSIVLIAMLLAVAGRAGVLAAEEPLATVAGETIDVRVVDVEAVVTDGRGHPVHGLRAADLALRRGEIEVAVTLLLPVAALAITPDGKGFAAEVPLVAAALDRDGGRVDLPANRLHVHFATLPVASGSARFRTTLKLRRADQRLVFAVPDEKSGGVLTAGLEIHPPA